MFGISIPERILILFVSLLLLGGYKNIPELAKNLGKNLWDFKRGHKESREGEPQGKTETLKFYFCNFLLRKIL